MLIAQKLSMLEGENQGQIPIHCKACAYLMLVNRSGVIFSMKFLIEKLNLINLANNQLFQKIFYARRDGFRPLAAVTFASPAIKLAAFF